MSTPSEVAVEAVATQSRRASEAAAAALAEREAEQGLRDVERARLVAERDERERHTAMALLAQSPLEEWFPGSRWHIEDTWTSLQGGPGIGKYRFRLDDPDGPGKAIVLVLYRSEEHDRDGFRPGSVAVGWPYWNRDTSGSWDGYWGLIPTPTLADVGVQVKKMRDGERDAARRDRQRMQEHLDDARSSITSLEGQIARHVEMWGDLDA